MKIDPNQTVDAYQEFILCEEGHVVLHDGRRIPTVGLDESGGPFRAFCGALDPNRCFVVALIPDDRDRDTFFRAREIAREMGLHMQAPIDRPERHRELWAGYTAMKRAAIVNSPEGNAV